MDVRACALPLSPPSSLFFRPQPRWSTTASSCPRMSQGGSTLVVCCQTSSSHKDQPKSKTSLRTCRNCKTQFDPSLNHPSSCRFHTAHFGGETKRKFESVYAGGTMNTPGSGQVFQYWHCCGSEDPFDPGCTLAPHSSYDD
ncbi:uncharacterized protein LOC116247266 [Nymphaea colorata]|nr:uncharacterized protein LOC116247266 [Nymphaea colorata]